VFAVRQGPILAKNLRAMVLGQRHESYKPQAKFLSLISTGDRGAVASWGNWFARGNWVWRWKDHIDQKFMSTFNELPRMEEVSEQIVPTVADVPGELAEAAAPGHMRCKGCGAKVGAQSLRRVLGRIGPSGDGGTALGCCGAGLLVGGGDDAAAFVVPADKVLVQSVDQFPVPVSDPFVGGQITANHCLGDLYAMGAAPHSALATVALPLAAADKREGDLEQLMAGAGRVFGVAGCRIIGGHTGEGIQQTLGFTVNGLATRERLQLKGGLEAGAALVLTKPIGTGAVLAGAAQDGIRGRHLATAVGVMLRSNLAAATILMAHGAAGMTDVTGFGLVGHLGEMLEAAGLGARLRLADVALIDGARAAVEAGFVSSLQGDNERAAIAVVPGQTVRETAAFRLLFDPQTAGGLLAGVPAARAAAAVQALAAAGYDDAAVIGEVIDGVPAGRIEVV
jgi:selenide,water dikinase